MRLGRPDRASAVPWALVVAATMGWAATWAAGVVGAPAPAPPAASPFVLATVTQGSVGDAVSLNASAEWHQVPLATNRLAGTVTGVASGGGPVAVEAGDRLYDVDLRPVVLAVGDVPAFRDLQEGMTGQDVRQLQQFLRSAGLLRHSVSGRFEGSTTRALGAWHRRMGVEQRPVVALGEILFVPQIPARVVLDPAIAVGGILGGGEPAARGLESAPRFTLSLPANLSGQAASGAQVEIQGPDQEPWRASVDRVEQQADGNALATLLAGTEGICGQSCSSVPVGQQVLMPARLVTVAEVKGLIVPMVALTTGADGSVTVRTDHGEDRPVRLVASAKGIAVVEGVNEGTRIRVQRYSADAAG